LEQIIERRDRLVPQDVRERKGSFFTPPEWVELSQKYMADVFGRDWQDEYYIWDCAAGTGNLLAGLVDKYKIWASTLDKADVNVMKDRIKNGANMLENHVFQFDFLNGDFADLPEELYNIISDEEKRKKLVVYINPPYAEGDARAGKGRKGIHESRIHTVYKNDLGKASSELFAQFLFRIYKEISGCKIANFSKLKILQSPNFEGFRNIFKPKLNKLFMVPADTFDNVKGKFPIGFFIWDTEVRKTLKDTKADVYDREGDFIGKKKIYSYDNYKYISQWLEEHSNHISENHIGHLASVGNDFQNQNTIFLDDVNKERKKGGRHTMVSVENLIIVSMYFSVRKVIPASWINDRDQFLFPNDGWKKDAEFQSDCFVYTLFNNNIQSKYGVNNWIPFTEKEVNASNNFKSNFMVNFINGKVKRINGDLFEEESKRTGKMVFSDEAKDVLSTGKKIWKLYHSFKNIKVNASFYDIREFFQERNEDGRMNAKSSNDEYNVLLSELKQNIKDLANKIVPKIFDYGFLLSAKV
jgi:hypothetical protein